MAEQLRLFQALQPIEAPNKNEWYTPRVYLHLAWQVMSTIDLDPASCAEANKVVGAAHYYTAEDDGLAQRWYGHVWLNPPYSPSPQAWVDRLCAEYRAGNVTEAILLVPPKTDTGWFSPAFDYVICFTDHRISFWGQPGSSNTFGSAFVYMGSQEAKFARVFSAVGNVVKRFRA